MIDAQSSALAVKTGSGSFALQAGARIMAMSHCYALASWTAAVFCRFRRDSHSLKRQRTGALQNLRHGLVCQSATEAAVARRSTTKAAGPPQGPFKIKNLLQKKSKLVHQTQSNLIKGLLMKKIPNFFPGTLTGNHWQITQKQAEKTLKKGQKSGVF